MGSVPFGCWWATLKFTSSGDTRSSSPSSFMSTRPITFESPDTICKVKNTTLTGTVDSCMVKVNPWALQVSSHTRV